jgi:hypothetical protein
MFLLILGEVISGPLFDLGHFKVMLLVGALGGHVEPLSHEHQHRVLPAVPDPGRLGRPL